MKKTTFIAIAVIVVVAGAIFMTLASNKKVIDGRKEKSLDQADVAVSVATVEKKQAGKTLEVVGTALADKEVSVAAESAGKIVQVSFKMGDFVSKGAVLAKIDDTYKRLSYENAKLSYDKCKDDLERNNQLRKGNAISETQLRDIKMSFDNAAIQLENAKKQLSDTRVVAPFSGYITAKSTELGAFVNSGNAVASMVDIANLKVTMEVSETNAYELYKGQSVRITSDVLPDLKLTGKISAISQKSSSAHTYPVEIAIPNAGKEKLKAGTYVNVAVDLAKNVEAVIIPRDAIVSSVKDPSVYVVKQGKAYLTKITTGRNFDTTLEVLGGLNVGDQVVTSGQINLSDGSKVTLIQ